MKTPQPQISITKEQLSELPGVVYPGGIEAVTMVDSVSKAKRAVEALGGCSHIGFDTETRPSFQRGQINKVALLQLSDGERCYLFRLTVPGVFETVRPLLENPNVIKVGLSVHDDFNALRRRGDIDPAGFLDLQDYCRTFLIADISLQKIFAIVFGERISKSQRLTNWEAENLNESQQIYAAIDAWACLKLYRYIRSGRFDPFESPYMHTETKSVSAPKS